MMVKNKKNMKRKGGEGDQKYKEGEGSGCFPAGGFCRWGSDIRLTNGQRQQLDADDSGR